MRKVFEAVKDTATGAWDASKGMLAKAGAAGSAMLASGAAFAGGGSDPAGAITAELSGLADSVGGIIVLLAAALAIIILWGYVKKSR